MKMISTLLTLTAPAFAQAPVVLVSPGDQIFAGETVENIKSAAVDSSGRWIAQVESTSGEGILSSEGFVLLEDDPVPGMPGAFVSDIDSVERDNMGNTYCRLITTTPGVGSERVVLRNFNDVLVSSEDCLGGPGFSGVERLITMSQMEINASGDLVIIGIVNDPNASSNYDAIVLFDGAGGGAQGASLEVDGSQSPAGQTGIVNVFLTLPDSVVLGDGGDLLWSASISGPPSFVATYAAPAELLAEEGQPSPVPGRNWDSPFIPTVEVNAGGTRLVSGLLDGSPATDRVYLLDGQPVLQEGDPAPAIAGSNYVILGNNPQLTDGGEIIHAARLSGQPFSQDRMILADDEILVQEGLTITSDGQTVDSMDLTDLRASGDGRWVLFGARLDGDNASSLLLLERAPELGQSYCSAEPNSTGSSATTRATGSLQIGDQDFRLLCDGMPVLQPGFFLASLTQGDVPFAGGSQGRLCLGGTIARFNSQVQNSGSGGNIAIQVDLLAIPLTPSVAVQSGETWSFQTWFRDMNPGQTSNFALPVAVTFQ